MDVPQPEGFEFKEFDVSFRLKSMPYCRFRWVVSQRDENVTLIYSEHSLDFGRCIMPFAE